MDHRPTQARHNNQQGGQSEDRALPRGHHLLDERLFEAFVTLPPSAAPGATPSSASGSLGSFDTACSAALLTLSRLERLTIDPSKTRMNANARPVSPMRMRCALLPAW